MRFEGQWEAEGSGQPSELALPPSHGQCWYLHGHPLGHLECVHLDLLSTGMALVFLGTIPPVLLGSRLEKGPEIPAPSPAVALAAPVRLCWWGWPPLLPHHDVTSTPMPHLGRNLAAPAPWSAVVEAAVLPNPSSPAGLLSAPGTEIKEERLWQAGSIHPSSWQHRHSPCQTSAPALAALVVSPVRAWAGFPPSLNQQVILLITDKAPLIKEEVLWQVPQSLAWGNGRCRSRNCWDVLS